MKWVVAVLILFSLYQVENIRWRDRGTGCPKGWIRFLDTDRCFYISPRADTYENAVKDCASRDSELAPPITCDEHFDLNALLAGYRVKCPKGQYCDEFWVGIHNLSGNSWKTPKDVEIDTDRKCLFWARNFPRGDGRCVLMSYKEDKKKGVWKNDDCERQLKYTCITCPNNFQYFAEISECFFLNSTLTNWTEARELCHEMKWGSNLLTIRNPRKQQIVEEYLKPLLAKKENEICVQRSPSPGKILWLSAQTANPTDCTTPYVWKGLIEPPKPFIYSNWIPGMPDCAQNGENCAIISPERGYRWEDIKCDTPICYVCEF